MSATEFEHSGRLRPNLRPLALALVANLLFGGLLIGLPYQRGVTRAEEAARDFARFSQCLLEGRAVRRPGLILPRSQRTRFASLALRGGDWPERCRDELSAIAMEEVVLLFPSVKSAENEVRAAVDQLARELAHVEDDGRVSDRSLLALSQLQAALSELVRVASAEVEPSRPAIALAPSARDLSTPSIVPLRIASGGRWSVGREQGAVLVSASDARSVGHAKVAGGRVDLRVARRGNLVSGMLGGREPPWVIWSTPPARCGEECASRATGLGQLVEDGQRLSDPWARLQAHPVGDPEDAVHVGTNVWIAALGANGELEGRRFAVPQRPSAEPAQLATESVRPLGVRDARVHWVEGDPPALAWVNADGAGIALMQDSAPAHIESPGRRVEMASAGSAQDGWIAFGSERAVLVRRADGSGATQRIELALRPPERGALRLMCAGESGCAAVQVWIANGGAIHRVRCDAERCNPPERFVERRAVRFDVARFRGATLLAWTREAARGAIQLTRIDANGRATTSFAGVCWQQGVGLCGEPRLAVDERGAVLVAREGDDLRVLATEDGVRWHALPGLEQP